MQKEDSLKIKRLLAKGFKVEVVNPSAKKFNGRYRVYQNLGWTEQKVILVNDEGKVIGLQG